jgi:hypothetical protein
VIIDTIEKYGCGKLNHLPLESMTKADIVEHLEECKCPALKEMKHDLDI